MYFPLITLITLSGGLIASLLVFLLVRRHHRSGWIDNDARILIFFFAGTALVWLLYAIAGFVSLLKPGVVILHLIADVCVFLACAPAITAACRALDKLRLRQILLSLVGLSLIIFLLGRVMYWTPYQPVISGSYIYWLPPEPLWQSIVIGLVAGLTSLFFAATFLWKGWRTKHNSLVFKRAMSLGVGMVLTMIAATGFFLTSLPEFWISLLAITSGAIGLLIMFAGLYKPNPT
jgi:hypothetical protein